MNEGTPSRGVTGVTPRDGEADTARLLKLVSESVSSYSPARLSAKGDRASKKCVLSQSRARPSPNSLVLSKPRGRRGLAVKTEGEKAGWPETLGPATTDCSTPVRPELTRPPPTARHVLQR